MKNRIIFTTYKNNKIISIKVYYNLKEKFLGFYPIRKGEEK